MIEAGRNWLIKNRIHVLVWGIFMAWEIIVIGLSSGIFGNPLTYIVHYTLVILLFYIHALKGLPWATKSTEYTIFRITLIILAEIVAFMVFSYFSDTLLVYIKVLSKRAVTLNIQYFMRELYRGIYFIGFATGYYYIMTYINERKKSASLERQRLQEIINRRIAEREAMRSQNALLIAQINPHFLFNTLDYLYHNLLTLDSKLADAVISLAGMMRFAISADKLGGVIRLGDEIEQVENLIFLHQVRQKLNIELIVDEQAQECFLIPLVVLTLTENVFKHGNLRNETESAKIKIFTDDNYLHIQTKNPINEIISSAKSLTGLPNIEKRLQVAYPERFTFEHWADSKTYYVQIKIDLSALNEIGSFSYLSKDIDIE